MKSKLFKIITLSLTCLSCVLIFVCCKSEQKSDTNKIKFVSNTQVINNDDNLMKRIEITNEEFLSEYMIDSDVDFPSELKLNIDNQDITSTCGMIIFPDGSIKNIGKTKLDKFGDYTVRYYFDNSKNNSYVAEKHFKVTNQLYSVAGNGNIVAVSSEDQQSLSFIGNDGDVTFNKDDALIVRLGEGDVFNFTKSIDLSNVDSEGLCNLISVDYRNVDFVPNDLYVDGITPSWKKLKVDKSIATYCIVRISDSYDSSNYIELYCRLTCPNNSSEDINDATAAKSSYYPYFSACASGQIRTALTYPITTEYVTYYNVTVDGEKYGCYFNNEKGGRSFSNIPMTGDHTLFTWKYDYLTNKVYIQQGSSIEIVSALSSSEIYGTDVFNGFSTSNVRLSIYMNDYVIGDEARIDIGNIGEYSGKELVDNFGKLGFSDDLAAPKINIDIEDTDARGIYVPLNSDFVIPSAQIISNSEVVSLNVYAYANYGKNNQIDIPINNNILKITKDIQYTIIYEAKNSLGCTGYKSLIINPKKVSKPITLETSYDGFNEIHSGDEVVLPGYTLYTINNSEKLGVNIEAINENEILKIDSTKLTFIPSYVGDYTIRYSCYDNVNKSVVYEYKLVSLLSDNVGFIGEIVLPRYFIKNAEYSLEAVPAYSFDSIKPQPIGFTAFISYDEGVSFEKINDIERVKINGSESAIVKYVCEKNGKKAELLSNKVTIVDVGYGNNKNLVMRDYFIHEGFTSKSYDESKSTDVQYDLNETLDSGILKFVNAIDLSSLNLTFKVPVGASNYERVNIFLTDYYDENKVFQVSFINNNDLCYVSINGQKALATSYSFADKSMNKRLEYDSISKKLVVNDLTIQDVDLLSLFNSNLCYLDIQIDGASDASSIIIDSINLQKLSNNKSSDSIIPKIYLKDLSGNYVIDSIITIDIPRVVDVLSPVVNPNVLIYVNYGEEYVQSTDGIILDGSSSSLRKYDIKLSRFGQYTITIQAKDGAGKIATQIVILTVNDIVPPRIEILSSRETTIKKGEKYTIKYNVTDDFSSKENIITNILFKDISSNAFYSSKNNSIVFNKQGQYEVYVFAKDESGNFVYSSVKVNVEE